MREVFLNIGQIYFVNSQLLRDLDNRMRIWCAVRCFEIDVCCGVCVRTSLGLYFCFVVLVNESECVESGLHRCTDSR